MFAYQSFTRDQEIRLLKFLPGTSPAATIIHTDIDKAPPYIALSYTWGSPSFTSFFSINGHDIAITENLAHALHAPFTYARAKDLMFWVDAVCIDQHNVHERSFQVRLMNAIYRSAESVVVWLGRACDDSDLVMDKMKDWKRKFDHIYKASGTDYALAVASIMPSDSVFHGPNDSTESRAWSAFHTLCQRAWWRRAWIVQEATSVGPSRTLIACGDRMIDWSCLRATMHVGHYLSRYNKNGMSVEFN